MSVLNAIRKQENPDGIGGHNERLLMQEESRMGKPKANFTRGREFHKWSPFDVKKQKFNKERLLQAKWYCRVLCCNRDCPLQGV